MLQHVLCALRVTPHDSLNGAKLGTAGFKNDPWGAESVTNAIQTCRISLGQEPNAPLVPFFSADIL